MKKYTIYDPPLKVCGVPFFEQNKRFERYPEEVIDKLPHLDYLARRCPGAYVAFKTDSPVFTVKVKLKTMNVDFGMGLYAAQSVLVTVGERTNPRHMGLVFPYTYEMTEIERTFYKSNELEQVMVYLPRNEEFEIFEIYLDDNATVTGPDPFKYKKPVVFYGSSITEGAASTNVTNAYTAILARWLDFECINLGLPGNARGELEIADYIKTIDMGVFVYDYDHNAPTPEFLKDTHKPFFDRIREAHPDLPIIMMTRPAQIYDDDARARREIVRATYEAAIAAGDKNVYFIDGEPFYGDIDRSLCTVDDIHPNDLGYYRMASVIRPVLEEVLEKSCR